VTFTLFTNREPITMPARPESLLAAIPRAPRRGGPGSWGRVQDRPPRTDTVSVNQHMNMYMWLR
jgi:hypothetical protein